MLSKEELKDIQRVIDEAKIMLNKPYAAELKADIQTEWFNGFSLDMLQEILSVAEYTSLFFFLRPEHTGRYQGKSFVYEAAYKEWAGATL